MSPSSPESLLQELVRDLRPVRRVPSMALSLAAVVGLAAGVGLVVFQVDGVRPDLGYAIRSNLVFAGVLIGLALAALGGAAAGLAGGVPGRQAMLRAAGSVAVAGLSGAVLLASLALGSVGSQTWSPVSTDFDCFWRALLFAGLPTLAMVAFLVRAWVSHPMRAAVATLIGGVALGAVVAHLSCPYAFSGARHVLVGHTSVALAALLVGTLPLAALLRRMSL